MINPAKTPKTYDMLQELFDTDSVARFIKRNQEHMLKSPFHEYLESICKIRSVIPAQVIAKSGIERVYGYHIFKGDKKPSRDKVIQLAFGFEMGYEETQELLRAANKSPLHPKVKRDVVIIFALNKSLTLGEVQNAMEELELPLIGKEGKYD